MHASLCYRSFIVCALILAGVSPAFAGKAWIWANGNTAAPAAYQFNSTGQINRLERLGSGSYRVFLPGLKTNAGLAPMGTFRPLQPNNIIVPAVPGLRVQPGLKAAPRLKVRPGPIVQPGLSAAAARTGIGTVHVSAYGGRNYCKTVRWQPKSGGQEIFVNCFTPQGQSADSKFTLLFLSAPNVEDDGAAYVWAAKSKAASYKPHKSYQWNSSGATNSVRRVGNGHYVVRYPGKPGGKIKPGGTMMVTAYGNGTTYCQAGDWLVRRNAIEATVYCFNPDGTRIDSRFTALFIREAGLDAGAGAHSATYLWAYGHKSLKPYTPIKKYQHQAATNKVLRKGRGDYEVLLRDLKAADKTGAFVTVYGQERAICNITSWALRIASKPSSNMKVYIRCFDRFGRPADAQFILLFLTDAVDIEERAAEISAPVSEPQFYKIQNVFYGTDRADMGESVDKKERFTNERDQTGAFSYGVASVSIPHDHKMGVLERPYRILNLIPFIDYVIDLEDPEKYVILLKLEDMSKDAFLQNIRSKLDIHPTKKQALIFIHGFNTSFVDAARRTAQLAYDLQFQGPALFYGWPSQEGSLNPLSYTAAEGNIRWSIPHIRDFIKDVISGTGVEKIHLIGHSMGTRGLTAALRQLQNELSPADYAKINSIILAAPDIDAEIFVRDIVPALKNGSPHITVYASDNDKPLAVSEGVHSAPRAGRIDDLRQIIEPDGVEVIDASEVKTSRGGHSYYGDNESIISDMRNVFAGATDMTTRCYLQEVITSNGAVYWNFNEGPCGDSR